MRSEVNKSPVGETVLEMSLRMPRFYPKNAFNASFSASEHGILSGKRAVQWRVAKR